MSYRKVGFGTLALLVLALAAHGELDKWVENVESGSKLEGAFFRTFQAGSGSVTGRRSPKETRAELTKLIDQTPTQADLISLRALGAEKQLDFTAAEADWKKYLELSKDKAAANLTLADYYHRRLMTSEEIAALRAAAAVPSPEAEPSPQKAWVAFERIATLIDDQALDSTVAAEQYQAWVARYPKEPDAYSRAFLAMLQKKQFATAEQILVSNERAFPGLVDFPVQSRAALELAKGSPERAWAVCEKSFQPLWPEQVAASCLTLLKDQGLSRKFLDQTRAQVSANPVDLNAAAKLYYYFRQQNDSASAARALVEFRKHKQNQQWTPAEHETLAILFDRTNQYDDAARHYHALYVHRSATATQTESALAGLVDLLLNAAEQPIPIGAGDLSYYRDIATMDRSPGYLNGVLSLLLNSQNPSNEYAQENGNAVSYFHRVKAAQLDTLFEQRYPKSDRRAGLRAKLIQAYATYGDTTAVVDNGRVFLTQFPQAAQRTEVALLMADGYARLAQADNEFALYNQLLIDLAAKAGGKPIDVVTVEVGAEPNKAAVGVRSQDYVRVLDRYLARLTSLNRMTEALRVYRNELTRNSQDPGLYERFAAFLDQNKLGSEIERVYKDAMQRFPEDTQWSHKLARWYLRASQRSQYADLTRQVAQVFSGTDLESYLNDTNSTANVGAQIYLQLNQYAHKRFPHNLSFVRNLMIAYTTKATASPAAYEQLLREHWYHAPDLRARFFELLSRTKRLDAELALLRTTKPDPDSNPAAARMLAEAEVWKTNYESAAQPFRLLAASQPAETQLDARAASLHRSLNRADLAVQIESNSAKADPRSREVLTRIGEIEADRERYDRAAPPWIKMTTIEPGKPEGYLDAATVFWDYFQFTDAIKMIEQARQKRSNPSLYAYEAGAIRENQRDYSAALNEYAKGALTEGEGQCRERLLRLAKRKSLAAEAESITRRIGASQNPPSITLRIAFLEGQNRAVDLQQYLNGILATATSPEVISTIEASARLNEMNTLLRQVIERRIAITADPVDRLRTRMELARFFESQNDTAKASQTIDAIYGENPAVYGVVRNAVNYYWRNKQVGRAVDLLTAAADRAQQPYQDRFRFEAAQKAIEGGQYDRGQQLIAALLDKEPYRADYLALSGDLYAKRGDDAGLRTYFTNTIESLKNSPLSAEEKVARVASLRRAFIPVLIRSKDYPAATDQYIEVINRYPEDEALVREATLFALQNGQRQRLTDYYMKTAAGSARDHRWPVVLSRIETQAENYPAALDWLGKARAIRPERTDFLADKGPIEERLMRFEDAAKTYTNLWELSYHDPSWMVKAGEQYQRLGRHADAISAVNKAFIEGRPESPANYLSAATQANQWNELDAAQAFLDSGLALKSNTGGLQAFQGQLAAHRHRPLPAAWKDMDASIASRWGEAVATYATPEEKLALAQKLTAAAGAPIAASAGLAELVTKWEPSLINGAPNPRWIQMQKFGGKIDEIGPRLEAAAKNGTLTVQQRDGILNMAREFYAQAGNTQAELRMLEQRRATGMGDNGFIARYAELAALDPKQALAIVSSDPAAAMRDAVANRILMNGQVGDAMAVIQARGAAFKPVWTKAYTALAGVYFEVRTSQVRAAFYAVLGPQTIGEQLGHPPNEDQQVAGSPWYYYATRYGEYLTQVKDPAGEDYLLAQLEASPGSAAAYAELAGFYQETGNSARAMSEYDYVLQLDPSSPVPHLRKAKLLAAGGSTTEAIAEWKLAFAGFQRDIDASPAATWWTDLAEALTDIGQYKALAAVREDADRVLRAHFKRNGQYNSEVLIPAILKASGDVQWLIEVSRSAPEPNQILDLVLQQSPLLDGQRDLLYAKQVENAQAKVNAALGSARTYLQENVVSLQLQRIHDLVARGNMASAERLLAELPAPVVDSHTSELATIQIRIAAKRGALGDLLSRYQRDTEHAPSAEILTGAATELRESKDEANANRVLEYLYTRELAKQNFTGPNFLGLAEVKLATNDLVAALELLRRMNLMVGAPFELLNDSGSLLWRTGHRKEAAEYFDQLVKVQPWQPQHRLNAALVKLEGGDTSVMAELSAIAANPAATYASRVEAAQAIRKAGGVNSLNSGTPEIDLIAGKAPITEAQASQPFYIPSRLLAAAATRDPATRLRLLSAAVSIAPTAPNRLLLFRSALETKRWFFANSLIDEGAFDDEQLRQIIEVKSQIGDRPSALHYQTQLALRLTGEPKAAIERAIIAQTSDEDRRNQNEARRPVISETLMPDRVVRPRLTGAQQ